MDLIGVNTDLNKSTMNSYKVEILDGKLKINSDTVSVNVNTNNNILTLVTDFIENDTTFMKFVINIDTEYNTVLEKSYAIKGNIMQNSYVETEREMLISPVYYNNLKNNFVKLFDNETVFHRFILNTDFSNLKSILETNIESSCVYTQFTGKNSMYIDSLNSLHQSLMQSIFFTVFVVHKKEDAQIVIQYGENNENNVEYTDNQVVLTISEDFYKGGFDAIHHMDYLKDLLLEHDFKDIKLELPKIEKSAGGCCGGGACGKSKEECCGKKEEPKEGCCGGGACGKSKEGCCDKKEESKEGCCGDGSCSKEPKEEPKLEKEPDKCCQNKPDSECCKKNKDIKCNCDSDSCKTKCKSVESAESTETMESMESGKYGFILYMKGTKDEPKCKFSRSTVEKLNSIGLEYNTKNILEHPDLRTRLKETHPTFPQLWYKYNFVCGGDTIREKENLNDYLQQLKF